MRKSTADVRKLMDQVTRGELRLPEIQRGYVWKPAQVASLIDSLYRSYPSGSLLLWETSEAVTEKELRSSTTGDALVRPLYLLDGQQRLTSLHRVYTGHERAQVVFNVLDETFQIESAATKKDPRWVSVFELITDRTSPFKLVKMLRESGAELTGEDEELHDRLERVRKINKYEYWLEILDDHSYEQVTDIFVRVNSGGRALKDTDLALATLSARWPGVVGKLEEQVEWCRQRQYHALEVAFLVRCLAAFATDTASPGGFATAAIERLEDSWTRLVRGLHHAVAILKDEVGIDNSKLIPSVNALVPVVYYLGRRPDAALGTEERNTLIYWLLVAFVYGRFSASAATVIAQDVAALRSSDPFATLYRNLGLLDRRLEVSEAAIAGKGSTSPYFLLSYLAARGTKARDWWYGVPVALSHDGSYEVEYHHIHPRARLKEHYTKAEINDLANLAFISDKANRKISDREPAKYFEELDNEDLERHFVPLDSNLRSVERFPDLVSARRALLVSAMNKLVDSYRPTFIDEVTAGGGEVEKTTLSFEAYGTSEEAGDVVLVIDAVRGDSSWRSTMPLISLVGALEDVIDGVGTEVQVGSESIGVQPDVSELTVPMGPLLVSGTPEEWQAIIKRELGDLSESSALPTVDLPATWHGERKLVSVLDSE